MQNLKATIATGENETLEFKPTFNQDVIETAAAFANTRGGRIVIGLSDSGEAVGTTFGQEALRNFVNRISNSTQPAVIPDAEKQVLLNGDVVVLTVQEYPLKPVSVRGRCYKRSGSVTRQMTAAENAEVHLQSSGQSPDARMVEEKVLGDLDLSLVKMYMTRAVNSGRRTFSVHDDPDELLKKLELMSPEGDVTLAALLLFGKNPQSPFSQAVIRAGRLRGNVDIVDDLTIRGPLMGQVDEAIAFIRKHMQVAYVIADELERKEIWDYPLLALREGLMNAICHRDYGDLAEIQIKIFDDALQIWSPGFLPFGVTVEDLFLSTHASKPRNRLISQVFYDMGMIERYGSGTGRVIEACQQAGLPNPEFNNFSGGFRILFASDKSRTPQVPPHVTPHVIPHVTPPVRRLIQICKGEMSRNELQEILSLNDRMSFKRVYLDPALEQGLVEMTRPNTPRSTAQKYRLTKKGEALLADEQ